MNSRKDDHSNRWFGGLIGVLGLYLLIRYTTVSNIVGIDLSNSVSGISRSTILSVSVIGSFILACTALLALGRSELRSDRFERFTERKLFLLGMLAAVLLVLGVGKFKYSNYTDEGRDVRVSNLINTHSLDLYTNNKDIQLISDSNSLGMLEWAQELHPPGQYIPAIFLPKGEYSILFYRLYFLIPTLAVSLLVLLFIGRFPNGILYAVTLISLVFSASYLRNYTLIRFGNELIPFFAFGAFSALIYQVHRRGFPRSFSFWLLGLILFSVSLFFKFSVVVGMGAVCGALVIGYLVWKRNDLLSLLFFSLSIFVASLVLYYLAFEGTVMLNLHANAYYTKILDALRLVERPEIVSDSVWVGAPPLGTFLSLAPFQYGPIWGLAFCYFIYCAKTRRISLNESTVLVLLFLVLGLIGVVLVYPRTQYTAPLMFGGAFLLGKCIIDSLPRMMIIKLAIIACLFASSEVIMMSFA